MKIKNYLIDNEGSLKEFLKIMKNLLITGSTGFIGKKLLKKLVKNYNVWCLVRDYQNSKNKNVRYIEHNLSYDIPIINLPNNIDTVIHLIILINTGHFQIMLTKLLALIHPPQLFY